MNAKQIQKERLDTLIRNQYWHSNSIPDNTIGKSFKVTRRYTYSTKVVLSIIKGHIKERFNWLILDIKYALSRLLD